MAYLQPYLNTPLPRALPSPQPVPLPSGNTLNYNRIFRAVDGAVYFVDCKGVSLRLTNPRIATLVPVGTDVTLDDLAIRPVLGQGFQVSSSAPGWQYNIAAFGDYNVNDVRASNLPVLTMTATPTHPFGWTGFTNADMVHGIITDVTNSRVYSFALTIGTAPASCFVEIERKL